MLKRYGIGAAIGALLAVLLGIPSFTIDREANTEPPLFRVYCDLNQTDYWDFKCVPGAGTAAIILAGAGLGAIGAAAFRRSKPGPSPTATGTTHTAQKRSDSGSYAGLGSRIDDLGADPVSLTPGQLHLVQEAARDLARRIDNYPFRSVPHSAVHLQIGKPLRERARALGIGDLAKRALDAAIEDGTLRRDPGPNSRVSRTSQPLASEAELAAGATSSDPAPAPQEDPAESSSDVAAPTAQDAEAEPPAPALLEELEDLVRLHERGTLTDAELEAAKARLLSKHGG